MAYLDALHRIFFYFGTRRIRIEKNEDVRGRVGCKNGAGQKQKNCQVADHQLVSPGMTKASGAASGFRKFFGIGNIYFFVGSDNKLCNTFSAGEGNRELAMIDENDLDFSPVICVDRSGAVKARNAVFCRKPAPWPYLTLESYRNFKGNACRYQCIVSRCKRHFFRGAQVKPGGMLGCIRRQRQIVMIASKSFYQ